MHTSVTYTWDTQARMGPGNKYTDTCGEQGGGHPLWLLSVCPASLLPPMHWGTLLANTTSNPPDCLPPSNPGSCAWLLCAVGGRRERSSLHRLLPRVPWPASPPHRHTTPSPHPTPILHTGTAHHNHLHRLPRTHSLSDLTLSRPQSLSCSHRPCSRMHAGSHYPESQA